MQIIFTENSEITRENINESVILDDDDNEVEHSHLLKAGTFRIKMNMDIET